MANEGALAALEKEFRSLLTPKLLAEAKAVQVVWARVKGYPAWPAQVLTEAAALRRKDLGQERHSKGNSVPVMFFGTVEVAWVKDADVVDFKEGLYQGFFDRKTKHFRLALEQVCEYLALDRKRKAPPKWWCKPPSNGLDDQSDGPSPKLVSAVGSCAAKGAGPRQEASKSSRQRTDPPDSDTGTSSADDEATGAHAAGKKGSAKDRSAKDGVVCKQQKEVVVTATAPKPRDSSTGRLPRDNGSTAASTNTGAHGQAKKTSAAPLAFPRRQPCASKEARPAGDAAKEVREGRPNAMAATSDVKAPPASQASQQQQRLRSSAGTSATSAKEADAGLQPRKRVKVEAGAVVGPTAASASSLPPPPPVVAKRTTSVGENVSAVDAAGIGAVDVLKLPAEIRRLAGIRLPALPKKPGIKVEESPRDQLPIKTEQAAASTGANEPTRLKQALISGMNVGMELRSARRTGSAARTGQTGVGRGSGAGQRKRSRSDGSSSGEEEGEGDQNSREEADAEVAASSDSDSSDGDSGPSEVAGEGVMLSVGARRSSRVALAAQSCGQATLAKVQSRQQPVRDRQGTNKRQSARFTASEPLPRRTSSRLNSKVPEAAPSKKASSGNFGTSDSEGDSEAASDYDSEEGGEGEDERSSTIATSSNDDDSASDEEPKANESGGSEDGGVRLRSRTRALQTMRARQHSVPCTRKARGAPMSQLLRCEMSQPADRDAKASAGHGDSDVEADHKDTKPQHREVSGAVSGPAARVIPLELRRLQNSPSAGIPVIDTSEPRTLRDRSSPARRAIPSIAVTPAQTAVAGSSAGSKRGEKRASEDGSGASMSMVPEHSRSPEHQRDGQKAGPATEESIPPMPARSQAIDGRSSKAGSASPPPAPVPGAVPVRKKPPSLGVPSTERLAGQVGARQLPAITPARAIVCSLTSATDDQAPSTLPAAGFAGTSAAGALFAPVAVCVFKKPSSGPPTRRLVEPGFDTSTSLADLPDAASLDCKADAKHASSLDVEAIDAVVITDGQLPRSPGVASLDSTGLRSPEEGTVADQLVEPVAKQQSDLLLPPHPQRQALAAGRNDVLRDVHMLDDVSISEVALQGADEGTTSKTGGEPAKELFSDQPLQEAHSMHEAQEAAASCLQPALELELGRGAAVEQQDQADPQPSSCCLQAFANILVDPVEQAPALPARSSVIHDQDNKQANRSPGRTLSAPAQLQHVVVEQATSALGPLARGSPGSPIHEEALISEEQLPDHGEAMAEHDGRPLPQAARLALGGSGGGSDTAFTLQVAAAVSKAMREMPSMPSPPPAAPVTPPEGHVASASGAVSAPPACAGSRASSEAECGAGALAGVSGTSCSAALWEEDDEAAARARELEELGEVAAALAGLHQAEVPRIPSVRLAAQPDDSQVPSALHVDSFLDRMPNRGSKGVSLSGVSLDNLGAPGSAAEPGFRWPQLEPLLPPHDQSFALPRDWLVTRPPRYEPVKRNVWLSRNKPKRLPKDEINICACRPPPFAAPGELQRMGCGPNCLNRLSSILCDAKLCPCGELCSNRSLHLLRQPKTEVFLTENRGWGVRTMEPLSKGAFIIEYAGEVIDERELGRRMEHARMNGEPHFYIMELSAGLYIDARRKGNIARLINSSCDPNCETQKWHDASTGEIRVGIFSSRDIAPGEELVYDYFFSTYGALKPSAASFVCMCGSKNCRGTMDLHPEKRRDLGRRVEVFWDADGQYYRAVIVAYHPTSKKHTVMYEDGGTEKLSLDEVPHRWMDDDQQRESPQKPDAMPSDSDAAGQPAPVEPLQQRSQAASAVDVNLADVLPVPDRGRCCIAAVPSQAPPRPLVPIDQRCLLPPLGSASLDTATTQTHGQLGKQGLPNVELHLPLKKRQRMLQPVSVPGHHLTPSQLSPLTLPLATLSRAGEALPGTAQPQVSGGSADCDAAPASLRNRHSGGGADSAGGEANVLSGRASLRHESSVTASGRISVVVAEEDDPNEDLDSLLEAAEAVAALRTAPVSNPPALSTQQNGLLVPQPRHIRSGSVAAAGLGTTAMVQTAKVASPQQLAAVQRAGVPNGLLPHGGSRPGGAVATLPSSSSSCFIPYQARGSRQHHSYGSAHYAHDYAMAGLSEQHQRPSQARNGRFSFEHDGSADPLGGSRGRNSSGYLHAHELQASDDINREDLLWKLVGIEKPKNLLPLFSAGTEKARNGDSMGRAGDTWISPSHPYSKLLRALEASELLPHADQLRLLAQQHAQQQAQEQAQPQQLQVLPTTTLPARPSGALPQHPRACAAAGSTASPEVLAFSAWHQIAQQNAQHQPQHAPNLPDGSDSGSITACLHHAPQHQTAATAAGTASAGQLHPLTALQNHGLNTAAPAAVAAGTAGAAGMLSHLPSQQQLPAAMTAAAPHWQHPVHSQPGSIMQDLVQLYVSQHATASHAMLAMGDTTTVGGSRLL
ncbi:hypothetical protein Vretifemale_5643 [Volvox reticuliferus]|uniref:Histone-lysine N-methyltransferase n=1 Tax=Volvox reticuliferus TaxID=1737510 RepID=A0A8J4C726_9CHLO|nr:hypothetical protein Vretifemale_5643 [Volvox reticuliferus]